ncbi:MAG: DUF2497 domain-containing protein [Caulobacteraceae bacterium]|nr:DUF2497 domain-containing protein [Caulobacter sp.]
MSDAQAQEPTMEEILASIRRIISEDEAAPSSESAAAEPPVAADTGDDVLELTHRAEPEAAAPPREEPAFASLSELSDLDVSERAAPEPPPPSPAAFAPPPRPAPAAPAREDAWVGEQAASAAASHFGALAQSLAMPAQGRTLEDVVSELLRPMLKAWLDQHLPQIVEARVQAEVERVSRGGGRY